MYTAFRSPILAVAMLGVCLTGRENAQPETTERDVRLVVQTGHSGPVDAVVFSPDGKRILTGGDDGVRLWDVATGKELYALQGHSREVVAATLSPDGRRILTGGKDQIARLWDAETGKELRTFEGHAKTVGSVAFAPDGKRIATGSADHTVRVWDLDIPKPLFTMRGHTKTVNSVAFAPDGKRILTGSGDHSARLWNAENGTEIRSFRGHKSDVHSVAFSPDGKHALTGGDDHTARVWDVETSQELMTIKGHTGRVHAVAFAPDGKSVLTASRDETARLWDAQNGIALRTVRGYGGWVLSAAFSPDSRQFVTGHHGQVARLWDAATGHELMSFQGYSGRVTSAVFAPSGKQILTASGGVAHLWDAQLGQQVRNLKARSKTVYSAVYSPDGTRFLTNFGNAGAELWDAPTGQQLHSLAGHTKPVHAVAFSPDGKYVLTGSWDHTARLWDAQSGRSLRTFHGHSDRVNTVAFSPDGSHVLTGSLDHTARLWDAQTGKETLAFKGHTNHVDAVAFSPDGNSILTASGAKVVRLWDARTGKELFTLKGHTSTVFGAVFSPDGKYVLTASADHTARLWNAQTGQPHLTFKGHTNVVSSVAFSPDGKSIVTASSDKTTRLWDAQTGRELCLLVSFANRGWAVVDPLGRYDASNGGDIEGLHWVVGLEAIALNQLKERYYDPGLLAKHLAFNKEPLRDVANFRDVKLFPAMTLAQPDTKTPRFHVSLTNRGGGIGRTVVLVNGKELTSDARPRGADADAAKLDLQLDLSSDPRIVPGQKNKIEVLAYNAEGYLSSRGLVREFEGSGQPPREAAKPTLHAIVVGVSKYRNEKLDLRYAAKDAEDFATALRLAAEGLFGAERVHLTLLTTADGKTRPTRAALEQALGALVHAKADDLVVVYLAGHGVTHGGQDGDWYYLTADAQSAEMVDPAVRKQATLSSAELTDLLKASPARKQVLILDTCHSGRLIEKLTEKRDVPGSQVRALERMKDRTGMHVLAGCAADSVSYEASRYGQGILTYSLLLGMRGAKLRENEYVDMVDLFGFAADKVPELARDIGGVQRPTIASPRGSSFDIGKLNSADRAKVPLQTLKPVLLRSVFQLEKPARDSLRLSKLVNEGLRAASSTARGAPLVFVDAEDFPGGLQASGRYKIDGDKVTVNVSLFEGEKERAAFTAEGSATKPDELAARIVTEIENRLAKTGSK